MIKKELKNTDLLLIKNDRLSATYYGCDQEWYTNKWQRMAGCGPTVATNIILYLMQIQEGSQIITHPLMKSECVVHMKDMWKYVTPSFGGVSSTKMLYDGVLKYANAKKLSLRFDYIDISKNPQNRPDLKQLLTFLDDALSNDSPVAFLNLHNGEEKELDAWHWVTLVSLEYPEDYNTAIAEIMDEGKRKSIDLALWLKTTTLGGGFVCFYHSQAI